MSLTKNSPPRLLWHSARNATSALDGALRWQDRELARVRKLALDPRGLYRPDSEVTSLFVALLVGLGAAAALDFTLFWGFRYPVEQLNFVDSPIWYGLAAITTVGHWWRQRAAYREYVSDKQTYDAAALSYAHALANKGKS